jgi:hypothetical protein
MGRMECHPFGPIDLLVRHGWDKATKLQASTDHLRL